MRSGCWQSLKSLLPGEFEGSYSLQRLQALEQYRKQTSVGRMLLVILGMPIPSLLFMVALNFVPLAAPWEGWKANSMAFIRLFIMGLVGMTGTRWQREFYFRGIRASAVQNLCLAVSISTIYVVIILLFSVTIAFPMPFALVTPFCVTIPLGICVLTSRARKRRHTIHQAPTDRPFGLSRQEQVKKYTRIVIFNFTLVLIYPIVASTFTRLTEIPQVLFIVLLRPIMRTLLFRTTKRFLVQREDLPAEYAVFSVKFFDSLFVAVCMDTTTSLGSSCGFTHRLRVVEIRSATDNPLKCVES